MGEAQELAPELELGKGSVTGRAPARVPATAPVQEPDQEPEPGKEVALGSRLRLAHHRRLRRMQKGPLLRAPRPRVRSCLS